MSGITKRIMATIVVSLAGGTAAMIGAGAGWMATARLLVSVRFIVGFLVAAIIGWWIGGVGLQLFPLPAHVNLGNDDAGIDVST